MIVIKKESSYTNHFNTSICTWSISYIKTKIVVIVTSKPKILILKNTQNNHLLFEFQFQVGGFIAKLPIILRFGKIKNFNSISSNLSLSSGTDKIH